MGDCVKSAVSMNIVSHLQQEWPETTDPQKFVFEELGIAAYLCLLFEVTPSTATFKYKFADLGCGNGLLTYILTQEGFSGKASRRDRDTHTDTDTDTHAHRHTRTHRHNHGSRAIHNFLCRLMSTTTTQGSVWICESERFGTGTSLPQS